MRKAGLKRRSVEERDLCWRPSSPQLFPRGSVRRVRFVRVVLLQCGDAYQGAATIEVRESNLHPKPLNLRRGGATNLPRRHRTAATPLHHTTNSTQP